MAAPLPLTLYSSALRAVLVRQSNLDGQNLGQGEKPRLACRCIEWQRWNSQFGCFVVRRDQIRSLAVYVSVNDVLAADWLTQPTLGLGRQTPCSFWRITRATV